MNAPKMLHDRQHEDLLHARVAGDVPDDDPTLTARLEECTACRTRLDELSALTGLLDRLGEAQRASLRPDPTFPAPGSDQVAATLHALASGRAPAPRPRPTRRLALWRVGLAAASVLAAGWIVKALLPPAEEPREDVLLGEGRERTSTPHGTVASLEPIDGKRPPSDTRRFELRVWRRDGADRVLVVEEPVEAFPWFPNPAQRTAMGQSIEWEIVPFDTAGVALALERGEATLRP
jgi:anti-sigma factor RsiW